MVLKVLTEVDGFPSVLVAKKLMDLMVLKILMVVGSFYILLVPGELG